MLGRSLAFAPVPAMSARIPGRFIYIYIYIIVIVIIIIAIMIRIKVMQSEMPKGRLGVCTTQFAYLWLVGNGRMVVIVVIIVPHSSIPY